MLPTSFPAPCPPNRADPTNKSEEHTGLQVNKAAPVHEIWAVAVASRGSVWHPNNLAVLQPSITTLAGSVRKGDKQGRHSFSRLLSSPCNKRKG